MKNRDIAMTSAARVLEAFQLQGTANVFSVFCCGRLYVGPKPALACRTCSNTPSNKEIRTPEDFNDVFPV